MPFIGLRVAGCTCHGWPHAGEGRHRHIRRQFELTVDAAGAISGLTDAQGREWAGRAGAALLWLRYSLGTNSQMAAYRETYCSGNIRAGDTHCGENTYGKPGLQRNESVLANATVIGVWSGPEELLVEVGWPTELHVEAGAPKSTWLKATAGVDASLDLEVLLVNKTSTRQLEAMFLTFAPDTPSSMSGADADVGEQCHWEMDKLGEWVSATDIMKGGSGGISPCYLVSDAAAPPEPPGTDVHSQLGRGCRALWLGRRRVGHGHAAGRWCDYSWDPRVLNPERGGHQYGRALFALRQHLEHKVRTTY